MSKAVLIINEFINSGKFNEIHEWLVKAAKDQEIELIIKTNGELLVSLGRIVGNASISQNEAKEIGICDHFTSNQACNGLFGESMEPDFILFWDKDVRLARYLEGLGYPVFNSSHSIEVCDDKSLTHLILQNAGISMPHTILSPKTYDGIGYTNYTFIDKVVKELGFPMIIKECFGSFGQQVYIVHDKEALLSKVAEIGSKPMLFQEYINSSFARDIRLNVVGEKVVAAMYRYSDSGDFRANISNGGKMKPYTPTKEQIELAISCCKILGLDFGGVDILFGEKEEPIICEVNSNAHFKNIFDCTGINVADYIISYIKVKLDEKHRISNRSQS